MNSGERCVTPEMVVPVLENIKVVHRQKKLARTKILDRIIFKKI
jgi:hypothetical protein